MPLIGVGNNKFPSSQQNIAMRSNQQQLWAINALPFIPQPIPQILIFLVWLIFFILIQVAPQLTAPSLCPSPPMPRAHEAPAPPLSTPALRSVPADAWR